MKFLTNLGLYLHIPFCNGKCAYCDFYSAFTNEELLDSYLTALIREIKQWGGKINRPIDTIYLGGGTPSQLTIEEIEKIHGNENWKLDTILQEKGNCHLYEKLGYKKTGIIENINERMDIVYYEKD